MMMLAIKEIKAEPTVYDSLDQRWTSFLIRFFFHYNENDIKMIATWFEYIDRSFIPFFVDKVKGLHLSHLPDIINGCIFDVAVVSQFICLLINIRYIMSYQATNS